MDSDLSPAAKRAMYRARVAGGPAPETIAEAVARWLSHCEATYPTRDGSSTFTNARDATRQLVELYGDQPLRTFYALDLQAVRECMIDSGYARRTINDRVGRMLTMFRHFASKEWIEPEQLKSLDSVPGLAIGRTRARETKKVKPVDWQLVQAVLPVVRPEVSAMIRLQWFSAARPGEVCAMTGREIERADDVWLYRPTEHKTAWKGQDRTVYLGPRCIDIVNAWWSHDRLFGYKEASYYNAIRRACKKIGIPHWHPQQLRHSAITRIAREMGVEAAKLLAGHCDQRTTERYVDRAGLDIQAYVMRCG